MFKILTLLIVCSSVLVSGSDVFYDFDSEAMLIAKVNAPAQLVEDGPYSVPRCLKLPLGLTPFSVRLPVESFAVKAGDQLGVSFNYRHSAKFQQVNLILQYKDSSDKIVGQSTATIRRVTNWGRYENIFHVPDKPEITKADLIISNSQNSGEADLFIDNIRMVDNPAEKDFYTEKFELATFDTWTRRTREQEKFLPGDGGRLFLDWQRSKFGESCFESTGCGGASQYPWKIFNLKVNPRNIYKLHFYYNVNANYQKNSAMILVFLRDKAGNSIKTQPRLMLQRVSEWQEISMDIVLPPETAFMDVALRFLNVAPDSKVYVNRISITVGKPELQITTEINSIEKKLTGSLKCHSAPSENGKFNLQLLNANQELIATPEIKPDSTFELDLSKLADGKFTLRAEAKFEQETIKSESIFYNFNQRAWMNLGIGDLKTTDFPPPPWTPVKSNSSELSVSTWNSDIKFTPTLGLEQITLDKKTNKLLKAPIRLEVNGRDIFTVGKAAAVQVAPASANYAMFDTKLNFPEYSAAISARVEFDGMIKYSVKLEAKTDITINALDFRCSPAITDYAMTIDGGWSDYHVLLLHDSKKFETKRFYPMFWLGNMDRGFYFATDKQYPQLEYQKEICHELNYQGDLLTKIVNAPLMLKANSNYSIDFACGSTPFRPQTKLDKPLRFRAGKHSNGALLWATPKVLPFWGYPISPSNPRIIADWLKTNASSITFFYQIPFFAMESLPQYGYFASQWKITPERIYPPGTDGNYSANLRNIDIAQKTWQDLYLYNYVKFLNENKFSGVYFDCVSISNRSIGDKFTYCVFPVREFLQRIYIAQRQVNPESLSFVHCGSAVVDFCNVFAEISLTGEHYRAQCQSNRYYLEFMNLEEFRVQNCGNIGPLRMFLPQFRGPKTEAVDTAVHTMGMVLAHDLLLYPSFIKKEIIDNCQWRVFEFQDAGKDNRFQPYWTNGAIDTKNSKVVASSQINSYGVLSYYLNSAPTRETVILSAPAGIKLTVYDPAKNSTAIANSGDKIELDPYMFKMVLIGSPAIWNSIKISSN